MCLPDFGLSMIAAGVSAVGQIASASAQSASLRAQSRFQERQSILAKQQGGYEAARFNDQTSRQIDQMRGQFLSSGIALDGSALDVIADSASEASLDEQAIKFGAQIRSDNLAFESQMSKINAKNAMAGGILGAAGDIVGGLAKTFDQRQRRTTITNPYLNMG